MTFGSEKAFHESVFLKRDFVQPQPPVTVSCGLTVLEADVDASVLVELDLLGIGQGEVVPAADGNVVVVKMDKIIFESPFSMSSAP